MSDQANTDDEKQASTPGADDADHVAVGVGVIGGHEMGETAGGARSDTADEVAESGAEVDDVASIVAQVRSQAGDASKDEVSALLRERLQGAGQNLSDEEIDDLARQVTSGDA